MGRSTPSTYFGLLQWLFVPLLHTTRYGPDGLFRLSAGLPAKTLETSQRVQNLLGLVSCGDQAMINA